ncbi:hypothetical protein L9F63_007225, partial [Diploptera punctata]
NLFMGMKDFYKEYNHIVHVAKINGFDEDIIKNKLKKFKQQKRLQEYTTLHHVVKTADDDDKIQENGRTTP